MSFLLTSGDSDVRPLPDCSRLQSPCFHNNSVYALEENQLIRVNEDGTEKTVLPTASPLQLLHARFGWMYGVSTTGRLFVFEDERQLFVPLNVVSTSKRGTCPHGVQEPARSLDVRQAVTTESSTVLVDRCGQLWSFPNDAVELLPNQTIPATFIELNKCKYWVRQIAAGRKHCVALVDFANIGGNAESGEDLNQTITTCPKCLEDSTLRLSTLMKNADDTFAEMIGESSANEQEEPKEAAPPEPPSTPAADFTAVSRVGLDRLFSRIRSPFFKSSTPLARSTPSSSRWYAVPAKTMRNSMAADGAPTESSDGGRADIELTTWTQPTRPLNAAGSITFSFCSLSNFAYSSGSSAGNNDEDPVEESIFDSSFSTSLHSFASEQKANIFCELWAWGANTSGQLGCGNTVPTRIPKRVKLHECPIIKLVAGDNHTLAFSATGEVYGWGLSTDGQLKINQEVVAEPTLIKLGSKVCVLDVAAVGNVSLVTAITEENSSVVACRFSKQSAQSNITRLEHVERHGWPLRANLFDEGRLLLVDFLPNERAQQPEVLEQLGVLSRFIRTARFVVQLGQLAYSIKEKTQREPLNVLSSALWLFAVLIAQMAEKKIQTLFDSEKLAVFRLDAIVKTFLNFHFAFVDAIADGAFNDLDLSENIRRQVEQLSLEHETESSKDFKRIRGLFSVPQRQFFVLSTLFGRVLAESRPATFWKRLENDVQRNEKFAKLTARNLQTYPRESPDCLLAGFVEEPECKINRITPSSIALRQFLGKHHTLLLIWTNAVDVIQKNTVCKLRFPLLRIQRNPDASAVLTLADPENSFEIEFITPESATHFLDLVKNAWLYSQTRANAPKQPIDFVPRPPIFEARLRSGRFRFSALHPRFANCEYEGAWLDLEPNGRGTLTWPDGRQYRGAFKRAEIDGLGEMFMNAKKNESSELATSQSGSSLVTSIFYSHPRDVADSCSWLKGRFRKGRLNGLGTAMFLNGDTYEGYWTNGMMNGYGVLRTNDRLYVGAFKDNQKHGYGVLSSTRERYLGQWESGQQEGKGALITIDGVFHEGVFEGGKFVNGRVVYETTSSAWDPTAVVAFEGKFDGLGVAAGKGTLFLNRRDQIVGTMHGRILADELTITNATYKHNGGAEANDEEDFVMTGGPARGSWLFDEKSKWTELFAHFLEDQLHVSKGEFADVSAGSEAASPELAERIWTHLAASISKIKHQKGVSFDDRLERVPDYAAPFSHAYYASVVEYWQLCAANDHHPLARLIRGVVEVFCCSYCSFGTISMYDAACFEMRDLLARCYAVARLLFVNLPPVTEMYSAVPQRPDVRHDDESEDSSSGTAETLSIGSLEELNASASTSNLSPARAKLRSALVSPISTTASLGTPCCDFLIDLLFGASYADLFTVYSERTQAADRRYWERVLQLNSHTDAHLLRYFDVKGDLWPTDFENARELDSFTIRVSARNKFYQNAVNIFQRISGAINPTDKLAILAETFFEITSCTTKFANVGPSFSFSLDDLLPPFIYVIVRAQVQHLGAEIRLMSDFCPHLDSSGEVALMFTILQSSYIYICKERGNP
ncbi:Kinase domain-containing protein [Aphelenchoides fujianensis]|nr:Kinase domain-containing protein [Aphelenchoides fujianensis]